MGSYAFDTRGSIVSLHTHIKISAYHIFYRNDHVIIFVQYMKKFFNFALEILIFKMWCNNGSLNENASSYFLSDPQGNFKVIPELRLLAFQRIFQFI